ncbi:iron ABC transporter permease [Tersicoccus phoenicis]|uniref:Iron ABC transporter permease n=1 Tax=Tersicoccus phoenicis TaxID=554083 RepID=A0A1R1LP73_9MICC|nr:iron ABC transporter permease [Tersicoccus phoenicis]OMH29345.1 iron ABC transporter permease [Tersicoccus phoenicis]
MLVVVAAAAVAAATLIPLGFVAVSTVTTDPQTAAGLVLRPRVGLLLTNTVALVALTVPLCVVLGVTAAWLVERTDLPGARVWSLLLAAPLAIPAFVNSYAWISTMPRLAGLTGGVLISVLSYFPLVYIPAAAMLRRLDPALEQSAASLGQGPWRVFLRVVLPQLRIAVLGGSLVVALHLLAEFGAFSMIRFDTFTTAIMDQYKSTFNSSAANMLAAVLVGLCLVLLVIEASARGNARYAKVGSGSSGGPGISRLRGWTVPSTAFVVALLILALGVPLYSIGRWLFAGGVAAWDLPELSAALGQSIGFGVLGALATTVLAYPVAWLTVRFPGRFSALLESVDYVASSMPAIVVGLAFITVTVHWFYPLYQTLPVVIAAYVLLLLPRALVNLRAGIAQVPHQLEEAAAALGGGPVRTFVRVTLRLTAPAAAAAGALTFLGVVNELTATLLLAPTGTRTLATRFWSLSAELDYAAAAPYALAMIVISLPMTYLLYRQSQKALGL